MTYTILLYTLAPARWGPLGFIVNQQRLVNFLILLEEKKYICIQA